MAYIKLNNDMPGIVGLLFNNRRVFRGAGKLAQVGLRMRSSLSVRDRELIAAYVSALNKCPFCFDSHGAVATNLAGDNGEMVACAVNDLETAPISEKMKALLKLSSKVQESGRAVTEQDIKHAREHGASDNDIHDTVLVAAMFCFYNRYVDGLGTVPMKNKEDYAIIASQLVRHGYKYPNFIGRYFMRRSFRKIEEARATSAA